MIGLFGRFFGSRRRSAQPVDVDQLWLRSISRPAQSIKRHPPHIHQVPVPEFLPDQQRQFAKANRRRRDGDGRKRPI
jgi:hypothetical protein